MSGSNYNNNYIHSLNDIDRLDYNPNNMKLNIPKPTKGQLRIVGSTAHPVINLEGDVNRPLIDKKVKITLELIADEEKTHKEFSIIIDGIYNEKENTPPPQVIPALAEWYGLRGKTKVDDETSVIVWHESFKDAAAILIGDLKEIGIKIKKRNGQNSIAFEYDNQNNYGEEGYGIVIENNQITIYAEKYTGAFYATRTLHQMLKNSCNGYLNNGYIRDYPKYPVRGFMIDVGRKFVKLDYLYEMMKTMSYYKMNDFQIHLNDNAIFLDYYKDIDEVLEKAYTGFRLESEITGNDNTLTSKDGYYTKAAFRSLIEESAQYGVSIVPEFDTPGHALSFVKVRPDLMYQGKIVDGKEDLERAAMLNLDHQETVPFIQSMYNEYLDGEHPVIGDVPIHIGSDEYYGDAEVYRKYVDEMLQFIRDDKNRTPRVWGSLTSKAGETPVTSHNVQMNIWNTEWAEPEEMLEHGFDIINIEDHQVYIVPGADYYHDYLNLEYLFFQYEPNKFNNGAVLNESHPQLIGGAFGLWNDQIDAVENGITSYDMFDRMFHALPIIAQKNWGTKRLSSFQAFQDLSMKTMYAPNTNPRFKWRSKKHLMLCYNFLEGIADISGNQHHSKNVNNITLKDGANFNGVDSFIELPLRQVGPVAQLDITFELTDTSPIQVLMETDHNGTIYAVNEDGYLGYKDEYNRYAFNYKVEANKEINLKIISSLHKTQFFINDMEITLTEHTKKAYNTFVLPLQRIGSLQDSLHGKITSLKLKN